jgi:predicted nucleotidyltransferase
MKDIHQNNSENSVEQNLSPGYVPKSKVGGLPMSNQVNEALKAKMDKTQKEIEKFKAEITKIYKFVEVIGVVPTQASKKIEEEYEISEADAKKGLTHILMVIPEKKFKDIAKIRLETINVSKKINENLWVHVMTPVDIWNLGLDSKFEVMEALSMSLPVLDKGLLSSLRVTQIHKSMVLKKFEKYVTSYVVGGSVVRGNTIKTSDIDVFIVIDDTDVKRMPRLELKEKLRGIIHSYIAEAEAIAGVKNKLSPQIYLMTDFWEAVKDAHPVMFSFIRDGIPLYDRGAFLPWKSLLRMGKIKPSPEAIDMFMSSGNKLKETIQKRIFDIATLDLFWGVSTPTQGVLMLYGQAPGTPVETVNSFRETFVVKEKLVEAKYADILEEIMIKVWKAYEHGKLKPGDVDGKELDRLAKNALDYIERLKELREQIEKRMQERSIETIYNDVFGMLGALLKKKTELTIIKSFDDKMIKEGKFPPRFLEGLKKICKTKKDLAKVKQTAKKKDNLTMKQSKAVDEARKLAMEITTAISEYSQRCEFSTMDKTRFLIKGKDSNAEVFFLEDTFIIQGPKVQRISGEKLVESNAEELQKQLMAGKSKEAKIDFKSLDILKKIFGEFELVY